MHTFYRNSIFALTALAVLCLAGPVRSEEEPEPPEPENPAVLAILESNPTTLSQLTRSAKIMADLGRPDLGKKYLVKIIQSKPSLKQLAELGEELGSPIFLDLAGRKEMLPEAGRLAGAVMAAANRQLQDPKRLAELIDQLKNESPEVRQRAMAGLRQSRSAGVGTLIGVLADPARAAEHGNAQEALARMGTDSLGPMVGMLEAPDPRLAAEAIDVLARMGARKTAIYLLRPAVSPKAPAEIRTAAAAALQRMVGQVPSRSKAVELLVRRAKDYFDGRQRARSDFQGNVQMWRWDEGKKTCVMNEYAADEAGLAIAARLARDAHALAGDDAEIRCLYLAAMLEEAARENGLDNPLPDGEGTAADRASKFGVGQVENVLERAMAKNHTGAAAAAARILGRIGTPDELLYRGPEPAPLVRAVGHTDRRLRLAALGAIVKLQPKGRFAGSSYVPQALKFFAASSGGRKALVAAPRTEDSRRYAGLLVANGFDVDTAATGREAFQLATGSPDYELALIDLEIGKPTADVLVQQLRRDWRSADLRVALLARGENLRRAEQIARRDPLTLAFFRPHGDQSFSWQLEQLTALSPRTFVDHPQRQLHAATALAYLAELGGSAADLYDLRTVQETVVTAVYVPKLGGRAVDVLEKLGTPESQRALVDLAGRWTAPLELRKVAVKAFRRNTEKYGILLTTEEIARQYERYNKSEALDVKTQHILGLILNYIEAPTETIRSKQ